MAPLKTLSIIILLMLSGCVGKRVEESINQEFYATLNEHVNSDYFSPVRLAGVHKSDPIEVKWEIDSNALQVEAAGGNTRLNFAPVSVEYSGGENNRKSSYAIKLYYSDGTMSLIDSLFNPERREGNVHFSAGNDNIEIILQPGNEYLKWKINPVDKDLVDSIVIKVTTTGPFYGGGERFMSTCLNGRTISNQPNDHYFDAPWDTACTWGTKHEPGHFKNYEPSYLQIPFVITPTGQAWYIDDAASVFITFSKPGEEFSVRIESSQTEFYSMHRNTPKEALETYTSMVGRQPELPDWAVGVWVNLVDGIDTVYTKANLLKEWELPATVIWIIDLYDTETSTGWQHWTTGSYGNPREFTDSLHKLGFKVLTYLHPYQEVKMPKTEIDNPWYKKLDSLGVILHNPEHIENPRYRYSKNGLYDFHKPLMGDIWQEMIEKILIRDNFDGWMQDFGELSYSFDLELKKWDVIDYGLETPLTPNQYANTYPLIYHKLSYLHADAINKDIATFCRSGSAGSAAYTKIVWGGDQIASWSKDFGYPSAISSGISCGLSGYSNWAPDILCHSPSIELWKRWVQFAAFTPIFRDHLWANKPTSIDIWTSRETSEYFKQYAEIHMSMVPYIQESLTEYRETGTPMVRHMMLEFPGEPESYSCEYQYMFGPKYLVAPVVEPGDLTKNIYFPEGEWKSYWDSDMIISAGEWITVPAPLDLVPVYERIK